MPTAPTHSNNKQVNVLQSQQFPMAHHPPSKQLLVHTGNDARPVPTPASNSLHTEGLSAARLPIGEDCGVESCRFTTI